MNKLYIPCTTCKGNRWVVGTDSDEEGEPVQVQVECDDCNGTGVEALYLKCLVCGGSGFEPMPFELKEAIRLPCVSCHGSGLEPEKVTKGFKLLLNGGNQMFRCAEMLLYGAENEGNRKALYESMGDWRELTGAHECPIPDFKKLEHKQFTAPVPGGHCGRFLTNATSLPGPEIHDCEGDGNLECTVCLNNEKCTKFRHRAPNLKNVPSGTGCPGAGFKECSACTYQRN